MNRAAAPLDLETIEAALGQFSVVVVNGGKRLFEEGRVRSLNETARPRNYEGEVAEKGGKKYQVTLHFGEIGSNLLCTCKIGNECNRQQPERDRTAGNDHRAADNDQQSRDRKSSETRKCRLPGAGRRRTS